MNKLKFFIFSSLIFANLNAEQLVNAVSILVDKEPITLYEIHRLAQEQNIPLKKAINLLIQRNLKQAQIKKLGIEASEFEVNEHIEKIAKANGMNADELYDLVKSKGISEDEYRKDIANGIKNNKLFEAIYANKAKPLSEDEMKSFYLANKHLFAQASSVDVSEYRSFSKNALQQALQNPMMPSMGVSIQSKHLELSSINKQLSYLLNKTPKGDFTPILQDQNGFVTFLINDKSANSVMSYEQAKPLIREQMSKGKEKKILDAYFDKLKASANIVVLRKP